MKRRLSALYWKGDRLILLDQTLLPETISYKTCYNVEDTADAIRKLIVRGAPAIGVAAAYALVLESRRMDGENLTSDEKKAWFEGACHCLCEARPTAVNLFWAVKRMYRVFQANWRKKRWSQILQEEAVLIEKEDKLVNRCIGERGASLFSGKSELVLLTHCNTGSLAASGIGTALGVIRTLHERSQLKCVYMDETRPLLQGSRLTASELMHEEIPCCLICDSMAPAVMRDKKVDAVITGADRIARNGDTANKIGTYGLAVAAAYHHIPFFIAAPFSTFDFSLPAGQEIVIEERDPDEVRSFRGVFTSAETVPAYNPAFDVTPGCLISGIITERGILRPPYEISIEKYERRLQKNESIHHS